MQRSFIRFSRNVRIVRRPEAVKQPPVHSGFAPRRQPARVRRSPLPPPPACEDSRNPCRPPRNGGGRNRHPSAVIPLTPRRPHEDARHDPIPRTGRSARQHPAGAGVRPDTLEPTPYGPGDGWRVFHPLPGGYDLLAVWGVSPADVWAVGAYGHIAHWNGETVVDVDSPVEERLTALDGWGLTTSTPPAASSSCTTTAAPGASRTGSRRDDSGPALRGRREAARRRHVRPAHPRRRCLADRGRAAPRHDGLDGRRRCRARRGRLADLAGGGLDGGAGTGPDLRNRPARRRRPGLDRGPPQHRFGVPPRPAQRLEAGSSDSWGSLRTVLDMEGPVW